MRLAVLFVCIWTADDPQCKTYEILMHSFLNILLKDQPQPESFNVIDPAIKLLQSYTSSQDDDTILFSIVEWDQLFKTQSSKVLETFVYISVLIACSLISPLPVIPPFYVPPIMLSLGWEEQAKSQTTVWIAGMQKQHWPLHRE